MKKRLFAIWLVLVLLTAAAGLSCDEPIPQGTIEVKATLCGANWTGEVEYTLTRTAENITGDSVDRTFTVAPDRWTCAYVSGGPAGAYFVDITPSPTQTLVDGGTITFTLNFELEQDASIDFLRWTINGEPVEPNDPETPYYVTCGDIIDVHFKQHVAGCEGKQVRVIEYSWLDIHLTGEIPPVLLHVLDDPCAVVKDPAPIEEESRDLFVDGEPVDYCMEFDLIPCESRILSVKTLWLLEKCTDYTKSINWLRMGECVEPAGEPCVLFEVLFAEPEPRPFTLISYAEVELADDEDVNPNNNYAESPPLYIEWVLEMDASIEFKDWTINGDPLEPLGSGVDIYYEAEVFWGDVVDVHFAQHVAGCRPEAWVYEYSWLDIHLVEGPMEPPNWVGGHVYDGPCGMSKDPVPLDQEYRWLFVDGEPVTYCQVFDLFECEPRVLGAEALWLLEKCTPYVKSINWFVIRECMEPEPWCVLFDLYFEAPGIYVFELVASAAVELADYEDVDPDNDYAKSPTLYLTVNIVFPP